MHMDAWWRSWMVKAAAPRLAALHRILGRMGSVLGQKLSGRSSAALAGEIDKWVNAYRSARMQAMAAQLGQGVPDVTSLARSRVDPIGLSRRIGSALHRMLGAPANPVVDTGALTVNMPLLRSTVGISPKVFDKALDDMVAMLRSIPELSGVDPETLRRLALLHMVENVGRFGKGPGTAALLERSLPGPTSDFFSLYPAGRTEVLPDLVADMLLRRARVLGESGIVHPGIRPALGEALDELRSPFGRYWARANLAERIRPFLLDEGVPLAPHSTQRAVRTLDDLEAGWGMLEDLGPMSLWGPEPRLVRQAARLGRGLGQRGIRMPSMFGRGQALMRDELGGLPPGMTWDDLWRYGGGFARHTLKDVEQQAGPWIWGSEAVVPTRYQLYEQLWSQPDLARRAAAVAQTWGRLAQ